MRTARATALALFALALGASASAAPASAPASAPTPATSAAAPVTSSSAASAPAVSDSCIERIPEGKARPKMHEQLPTRGVSGHALTLEVVLNHGKGESVLPMGVKVITDSPELKALERAEFILPDPAGLAGPKITRVEHGDVAETTVQISVVPLPPKPGRQLLTLPPLPIALSRASGEVLTLCTQPHEVTVEDPIANTPNAKPKRNPTGRRQREIWTLAKQVVSIGSLALVIGALAAWLIGLWLKRPKKLPPPPPPRPPWEVAREALYDVRHAGLTREGRFSEHFDRVSDVIRRYLGDRYGFDGLESTTREAISYLREVSPYIAELGPIETFLRDADLVKFAQLTPSESECLDLLERADEIVTRTIPAEPLAAEPAASAPDAPDAPDAPEPPPGDAP
ncbi:MAG TPA: hypothetical protein VGM29_16580 [Polyangiaceae bacterium]